MLKKSRKALGSCYHTLSYATLFGSLLFTSGMAQAEEQNNFAQATSSVSDAAVHALSNSSEDYLPKHNSAQGITHQANREIREGEESANAQSLLDAVSTDHVRSSESQVEATRYSSEVASLIQPRGKEAASNGAGDNLIAAQQDSNLASSANSLIKTTPSEEQVSSGGVLAVAADGDKNSESSETNSSNSASHSNSTNAPAVPTQGELAESSQDAVESGASQNDGSSVAENAGKTQSNVPAQAASSDQTTEQGQSPSSASSSSDSASSTGISKVASSANSANVSTGHPLESAGQNKFGNYRNLQNQSKGPLSEGLNTPAGIFQWMISTIGVLLLIFFLAYMFRKSRFVQRAVGTMQIEGQIALGQKERLMKVRVGERTLLLGVTSNNINLILDLDAPQNAASNSKLEDDIDQRLGENESYQSARADAVDHTGRDSSKYSAAYRSAQEAYNRKQYEDILVNLSKMAASAAASAAVSAVHQEMESRQMYARSAESLNRGGAGYSGQSNGGSAESNLSAASALNNDGTSSLSSQYSNNGQNEFYGDAAAKGLEQTTAQFDLDGQVSNFQQSSSLQQGAASSVTGVTGGTLNPEPLKAKAIIEPHANEAHNIANHFSSEHTIVRASKSTQFMSSQFGMPPDSEVLHARAQRSKHHNRELESSNDESSPRSQELAAKKDDRFGDFLSKEEVASGELDELQATTSSSTLELKGVKQGFASESERESDSEDANAQFGSFLDHAMEDLSKQLGPSSMADKEAPWIAEDDLAQELEEHTKSEHQDSKDSKDKGSKKDRK